MDRTRRRRPEDDGVGERRVVRDHDRGSPPGQVLETVAGQPEIEVHEREEDSLDEPVEHRRLVTTDSSRAEAPARR